MTTARTRDQTRARIAQLLELRQRIDDELTILKAPPPRVRGRRMAPLPCGTEQAYQRHAHLGDTATEDRRVGCDECRAAHAEHGRIKAARARLARYGKAAS